MYIYKYTARQAVEDGVLVEVGDLAKEAGFKIPVRITAGVHELVTPGKEAASYGQSYNGRLWDVLFLAVLAIRNSGDDNFASFRVTFQNGPNEKKTVELWALPDGTSGPAIHILLPSEY